MPSMLAADCGSGHEQTRNNPTVRDADDPPTDRWTVNSEPLLSICPRGSTPCSTPKTLLAFCAIVRP